MLGVPSRIVPNRRPVDFDLVACANSLTQGGVLAIDSYFSLCDEFVDFTTTVVSSKRFVDSQALFLWMIPPTDFSGTLTEIIA